MQGEMVPFFYVKYIYHTISHAISLRPEPPWQGTVAKDGFSQLRMAWRAKDVAWRAKDSMAWRAKRAPTPKGCQITYNSNQDNPDDCGLCIEKLHLPASSYIKTAYPYPQRVSFNVQWIVPQSPLVMPVCFCMSLVPFLGERAIPSRGC